MSSELIWTFFTDKQVQTSEAQQMQLKRNLKDLKEM